MSIQTDVKAARVAATGAVFGARTRVKAVAVLGGAAAGTLVLTDGGAGGTTKLTLDIPATALSYLLFPGEGILFENDVYATLTGVTSLVAFYG